MDIAGGCSWKEVCCASEGTSARIAGDSVNCSAFHVKRYGMDLFRAHLCDAKRTAETKVVKQIFGEFISSYMPISHFFYKHSQHIFCIFPPLKKHYSHTYNQISTDTDYIFFHVDYLYFSVTFGKEVPLPTTKIPLPAIRISTDSDCIFFPH